MWRSAALALQLRQGPARSLWLGGERIVPSLLPLALLHIGVANAITCAQSTCSDGFCITQDVVTTVTVDCDQEVRTYTIEQDDGSFITYNLPSGRSTNNVPFDSCQKSAIRLSYGQPVVTTFACATASYEDRMQFKCHQVTHGMDPWSADGLTEAQAGGGEYVYHCCDTDECTTEQPADVGGAIGAPAPAPPASSAGPAPPGFSYSQDPAWQDGTGRNCVCATAWDAAAGNFDVCDSTAWANPLMQSDSLGECEAFSDQGINTWRIKLQGIGTKDGFAVGVDSAMHSSWAGWCVNCEAGSSQVHFYSDSRCSTSALVASYDLTLDTCSLDGLRNVHYSATCGDPLIPALPCPGTVFVEPVAVAIGVHSNAECRGSTVGGYEWRVPVTTLAAAPAGGAGSTGWGADGACIPLKSLQSSGGLDDGGFLMYELLVMRATGGVGFGAGTPLGDLFPRTPRPHTDNVAFRMCASAGDGLRFAWFSDLSCTKPMVLSAPLSGGTATSATELWATNGTTGMDYGIACTSAGALDMRSSRAQPVTADGLSVIQRWVYVELNATAMPLLSSCPALPPPPPPDVDCVGEWEPCTAACETDRVWIGEVSSLGLGEECPANEPCAFGVDDCVENAKIAVDSGIVLIILIGGAGTACVCLPVAGCGLLWKRKKRLAQIDPKKKRKKGKGDALDDLDSDSTDSDEETALRKQQIEDVKSGTKTKEEVNAENDARKKAKADAIQAKREERGEKSVMQMMKERQQAVQDKLGLKEKVKGSEEESSSEEEEEKKPQIDSTAVAASITEQGNMLASIMQAKAMANMVKAKVAPAPEPEPEPEPEKKGKKKKDKGKQSPINLDDSSSSESDSDDAGTSGKRKMAGAMAGMRGAAMLRGRGGRARGGRGGGRGRGRGGFARAAGMTRGMGAFGRGGSRPETPQGEVKTLVERTETGAAVEALEDVAKLRATMDQAAKEKARTKARARAAAKRRAAGDRGSYMTDTAAPVVPEPDPEPEPEVLPGQITESKPAAARSWMDDAPGGTNAKAKAAAAAGRVAPKLRISTIPGPSSLSSLDLKEALRQQQAQFSDLGLMDEEAKKAEADAVKAKAKAKARARAVAAARQRQGLGNDVLTNARNNAVSESHHNNFKQTPLAIDPADHVAATPAQKAIKNLPANDVQTLQAMLRELDEDY